MCMRETEKTERDRDGENDGAYIHTHAQAGPDFCYHL